MPEGPDTRIRLYMRTADSAGTRSVGHHTEEIAWGLLGTSERLAELGRLMEQAKAAAQTDLEQRRVALFETGVWQYMLAGKQAYGGDLEIVR
jgi:hypothetical protein